VRFFCRRKEGSLLGEILGRVRFAREPPGNTICLSHFLGTIATQPLTGRRLCGSDHSLLSEVSARYDLGMADGANKLMTESRLDRDSPRPLQAVRRNLHFPSVFSLPYTHYSLIARSEALRRYFLKHCSWESAVPRQRSDRVPDPSTLRRWFHSLDSSRPAFSFLRPALETVGHG